MKTLLLIGCGSFVGGVLRYLAGRGLVQWLSHAHWATLAVNVLGSFILGFLALYLSRFVSWPEHWRLALTVGLCGGFTTFSSFAHESIALMQRGAWLHVFAYGGLSVLLSFAAVLLGFYLAEQI